MNIIFAEKNKKLRDLFKKEFSEPYQIDVVEDILAVQNGNILVSCSNPTFSAGGGIDALLKQEYPEQFKKIREKYKKVGIGFTEKIDNILFAVTVDENFKTDKNAIKKIIKDIIELAGKRNYNDKFKIVLTGLGTGIGRLEKKEFINLFREVIIEYNIDFGNDATFGDYARFGNDATFGDYARFGNDATFGDYARFGNDATFGYKATFGNDATFGYNATFGNDATFGYKATFGDYARFGYKATFGDYARFGYKATFGNDATFGYNATFGNDATFGKGKILHPFLYGNFEKLKALGFICEKENSTVEDFWKVFSREKVTIDKEECFVFFKAVDENYKTQGNLIFKLETWVEDDNNFVFEGSCVKGGIYFSHYLFCLNFNQKYSKLLKIAVPVKQKEMCVDPEGNKCRAKRIYVLEEIK